MTREQLLSLIGKGKQKYKDMQIEVSTSVWSAFNNAKTVHVTLYPVNRFSTPARFGGGFIDDVTEQDCAELDAALEKAVGQMRDAERRAASEPLRLTPGGNDMLVGGDKRLYAYERYGSLHFTVYVLSRSGERDYAVSRPIVLNGKLYKGVYSFWLGKTVYLFDNPDGLQMD